MASLFSACKSAIRNNSGGTYNIGGYDIELELYHQEDIEEDVTYGDVTFGDSDESKIVVVSGDTITVPSGYTLTPDSPKKSLVIFCNNLVNNGTISMYQKAPNTLPHDYFIIEGTYIGSERDVTVSAYANNSTICYGTYQTLDVSNFDGKTGINRNCGSGGVGSSQCYSSYSYNKIFNYGSKSGSGYAFGGGAGSGGVSLYTDSGGITYAQIVNETYPMQGGNGYWENKHFSSGGVGNPKGANTGVYLGTIIDNNFGCGGRIIIFCTSFENNGTITVNGTSANIGTDTNNAIGGASGAGAIDLFYTTLVKEGIITANGGSAGQIAGTKAYNYVGKGGNGSITLTAWTQSKLVKGETKFFSQSNVDYLLEQLAERIRDSHMGE